MQVEDRATQLPDRCRHSRIGTIEGRVRGDLVRLLDLVPSRQEVLERLVVERLGECLRSRCSAESASVSKRVRLTTSLDTASVRRASR